ncbi:MAG: TipAS antibiotic-recognition domain-containing protein [Bacillota bacterium]|nr:TipAS antibiotic-recognition domain-containing protein [Bacillota bacterium]
MGSSTEDSRFTAHYDAVRPGLAEFMRAAMHAYCDKQEGHGR